MVNSEGQQEEVTVVNSELDYVRDEMRHAINFAIESSEREKKMRKNDGIVNKVTN